eukprot:366117-Chlamydomonas_euryale.AAC.6
MPARSDWYRLVGTSWLVHDAKAGNPLTHSHAPPQNTATTHTLHHTLRDRGTRLRYELLLPATQSARHSASKAEGYKLKKAGSYKLDGTGRAVNTSWLVPSCWCKLVRISCKASQQILLAVTGRLPGPCHLEVGGLKPRKPLVLSDRQGSCPEDTREHSFTLFQ